MPNTNDHVMLQDTQVFEAMTADMALIEVHYTRTAAQTVCDAYTAQFNEATRVGVSFIDRPETIGQRNLNNK